MVRHLHTHTALAAASRKQLDDTQISVWRLSWTDLATIYVRPERTELATPLEAHQAGAHGAQPHLAFSACPISPTSPTAHLSSFQAGRADFQLTEPPWKELYPQSIHIALERWRQVSRQTRPDERVRETLRDIWGLKREMGLFFSADWAV